MVYKYFLILIEMRLHARRGIDDYLRPSEFIEVGIKNMVYKFADDTKVLAQVHSDAERKILQEDLDKLTEWTKTWQMSFNTKKV